MIVRRVSEFLEQLLQKDDQVIVVPPFKVF